MVDALDHETALAMLATVCQAVVDNVDVLSQADREIGDGDHGVGMRRGFEAAGQALQGSPEAGIEDAFKTVGTAIMGATGGAAGAVFGTLFRSGAKAFAGSERLDAEHFAGFLETAVTAVAKRGGVIEGQKTMLDALAPAARSARGRVANGLAGVTAAAAEAAEQGVQATCDMIATTGKARSLGERSLGHPDPGAISISIILGAMRDFTAQA